jgi:hypothetical protein
MPDIVGQDVEVGDSVLFNPPHKKGVAWGKVIRVLPKSVEISYQTSYMPAARKCTRRQAELIVLSPDQLLGIAEQKLSGDI